jgi:predicted nucleic acid-binding protein
MTARAVYLDTNVIIAIIEGPSADETGIQEFWMREISNNGIRFHTSEMSFAELLVIPYRTGNGSLAADYVGLFEDDAAIKIHPVNRTVLDVAAVIRSERKMKLPDAIHLATASSSHCSHFLTFDRGIADLDGRQHPVYAGMSLSPVKIVQPDPVSLSDLTQALS